MFRIFIRVVFIFAYGAFLYASLRHIAYFFASFEPTGTDWTGAYALAISIDATVLVLTIGVMFFRRGMSAWVLAGIWFFILGLTAFSWAVNWEYAVQFQGQGLNKATTFYWINPILASAFAFLNVAYAVVAELFASKPETAEELKQKNDEMEQLQGEKNRHTYIKNQGRSLRLKSLIGTTKDVVKEAFAGTPDGTIQTPELEHLSEVQLTDEIALQKAEIESMDTGAHVAMNATTIAVLGRFPKIAALISAGRRTATIKEVAEATDYSEKWIKDRRDKKVIRASSRNTNLIVLESVIAWLNSLPSEAIKIDKVPATNGTHS